MFNQETVYNIWADQSKLLKAANLMGIRKECRAPSPPGLGRHTIHDFALNICLLTLVTDVMLSRICYKTMKLLQLAASKI